MLLSARSASTPAHLQGAVWLGNEKGLEEQSRNLSTRAARNRSIHLAHLRSGWTDAAAAFPKFAFDHTARHDIDLSA
jgi:hypothetical protein